MKGTAAEWGERWSRTRDPVTAAAEMIDIRKKGGAASSSILTAWRCLTAVAYYIGMPARRLALLGRAVRRQEGVVSGAAAVPAHWFEELLAALRGTRSEAADAVIASIVGGGARYQSILCLRRGDITPEGGVVIRRVKVGSPAVRRYFPPPPGSFLAERLAARGAPEPRGRWAARERIWSSTLTREAINLGSEKVCPGTWKLTPNILKEEGGGERLGGDGGGVEISIFRFRDRIWKVRKLARAGVS